MTENSLQRYYYYHSRIYDLTRWSFLFGRRNIVELCARHVQPRHILEVGCGTGSNLLALARHFPMASVTGVDLSADMLGAARRKCRGVEQRINLVNGPYERLAVFGSIPENGFDLILFSYALSMFNPGWESAIHTATRQLSENGIVAVVDFHRARTGFFRKWMQLNHVEMQAHLLPVLEKKLQPLDTEVHHAYAGLWEYCLFTGRRPARQLNAGRQISSSLVSSVTRAAGLSKICSGATPPFSSRRFFESKP